MPKRKDDVKISELIETRSDDEMALSDLEENVEPPKRAKGRPKMAAKKKPAPKKTSRQETGEQPEVVENPAARKNTTNKRQALKEKRNDQHSGDVEELEEPQANVNNDAITAKPAAFRDELNAPVVAVKQAVKGRKPQKRKLETVLLEEVKTSEKDEASENIDAGPKTSKTKSKALSAAKDPSTSHRDTPIEQDHDEVVIPETQQMQVDVDESLAPEEPENTSKTRAPAVAKRTSRKRVETARQPPANGAGSASDIERAGTEPATRRRLGELTHKLESLDLKYQNLKEVGIKEAEANFDKLKKQSEERSKSANELIASLKRELTTQTALAKESRSLQKQLSTRDSELSETKAKVVQLSTSLVEAQNETKAVQAKLAASRTAAASVESVHAKVPGSAMKPHGQARTLMVGSAEAAQAAQVAQLKEDLYSDLTGLILRGVKRGEDLEVYDCIQTGRNGTLHFKLAIATEGNGKTTSYEDTEFQYTPHLDADRDSQLLELLPDYLAEEITFSRQDAAKFYGRVVEALTKKKRES